MQLFDNSYRAGLIASLEYIIVSEYPLTKETLLLVHNTHAQNAQVHTKIIELSISMEW